MQDYVVRLECDPPVTYRTQRAADSVNLNIKEKSVHELKVRADLDSPFSVGCIYGASGSGKTTLATQVFGTPTSVLDPSTPIIEQFPKDMSYESCVEALTGVGLSSIPCWIRPVYTLSNGQRARAEAALAIAMAKKGDTVVFDEWTSTVDRNVAKIMSHRLQKVARKKGVRVVVCSCHYDVLPWLEPDWSIDCNEQKYEKKKWIEIQSPSQSESALPPHGGILASITI